MEDIRIVKSQSKHFICDEIKFISTDGKAIKEMGESFIYHKDQIWTFAYINESLLGFSCHNKTHILYIYVLPEFRRRGLFSVLYNELPIQPWTTIASNSSYKLFLKKGFEVVKNYKNCHKLIKK